MQLAKRVFCQNKKDVQRHRKLHKASYEKIITMDDGLYRYYSNAPCVALGEAFKAALTLEGETLERVVVMQEFENEWFATALVEGRVQSEWMGTLTDVINQVGYELHHATRILVSSDTAVDDIELFHDKVVKVSPLLPKEWEAFALENAIPHQRWKVKALGGVLGVGIIGGTWWWQSTPPPPVATAPEKTPFELYIASYSQKHSAYMALRQALSLYIETRDMPGGMMTTSMDWKGGTLTLPIDVTARDKVVRDYFKAHPTLKREWNEATRELVRHTPSVSPWKEWHIKNYLVQMRDTLELMEVSVTSVSNLPLAFINVQTFELKAAGHIGKLIALTEALNAPFVSITGLHWTWQSENQHQLTLTIDVQGVTQ
ncbi:hypothetical protein [Vibrio maritimus]|uniref:hypothetical protein n=1 Tax=Vibrio maritimus TaxID=990268 RepID=UPI001F260B95|nr:hypothetical protein [Vibrio maritimus]